MKRLLVLIILLSINLLLAEWLLNEGDNVLEVLSSRAGTTRLNLVIDQIETEEVEIRGEIYHQIKLPGEAVQRIKENPELPYMRRSLLVFAEELEASVIRAEYEEYDLSIVPSRGRIDFGESWEDLNWEFGNIYNRDSYFPNTVLGVSDAYVLRDFMGVDISINPVQYNPVSKVLRVCREMEIEIKEQGRQGASCEFPEQIARAFAPVYKRHFINYQEVQQALRYPEMEEIPGRLLIVCYNEFMEAMQPLVEWKKQKGIETELISFSNIGSSNNDLLNYLEAEYTGTDDLVWVLLVGDAQQIPVIYNYDTYAGDVYYACVSGTDLYPDIMVGRFSAESTEDVATQVERTIYYERDISDGDWMQRAAGVAYNGSGGGLHNESGPVHMNYIRDDLLEYGYLEVDQLYEGQGGTTQTLANAINAGRGVINYLGHGEDQNYYSIPFYMNDVYGLENEGMLPFVCNGACLIGNFAPQTCFAEYWLRARDEYEEPIGAIAFLASSVSQWIGDPEYGQDEFVDILCAEEKQTIGGLWYNCISYAMEVTTNFDEFCCWNVFGDPSLSVRTKITQQIELSHLSAVLMGLPYFEVDAAEEGIMICLLQDGEIIDSGYTDENGQITLDMESAQQEPGILILTASGLNKETLVEEIAMIPPEGEYLYLEEYLLQSGDDNVINAGETAFLNMELMNYGNEPATDVALSMQIEDEYITMLDSVETIGDLGSMENIMLDNALCFAVSDEIEYAHPFCVELEFTSEARVWEFEIWFSSFAPDGLWMNPAQINLELAEGDSAGVELIISNYMDHEVEIDLHLEEMNQRDVTGSVITCDTGEFLAGTEVEWRFTASNFSEDNEWICGIELDFPDCVEVSEVSNFTGGSGGSFVTESELGVGAEIIWTGMSPNNWGYLQDGESAEAIVSARVEYEELDSLRVDWRMEGDGYGEEPHEQEGELFLFNPLSWIYLNDLHDIIQPGDFSRISIDLNTRALPVGSYQCEIVAVDDRLETRLPVNLEVTMPSPASVDEIITNMEIRAYPNPFNPELNIYYQLPEAGRVELSIYNVKGQKIRNLLNEYQQPGRKQLQWKAGDISSGIYFLKLSTNANTTTEKVLLLK